VRNTLNLQLMHFLEMLSLFWAQHQELQTLYVKKVPGTDPA